MRDLIHIGMIQEPINNFKAHSHEVWEVVYYIFGEGTIIVGDAEIPFQPGVIVCLPPNISHSEHSDTGYRNYYWLVRTIHSFGKAIPVFRDNGNGDYCSILSQLYREYHLKQNNWQNITESLLGVLHNYMVAWNTADKHSPLVERFLNTLVSNISNPNFKIEAALKDIPLSPDYFRRIFKEETGSTPLEYLLQKRVDYSRELLSIKDANGYKIKEIAVRSGFEDQYYFSRLFHKYTGVSPRRFAR